MPLGSQMNRRVSRLSASVCVLLVVAGGRGIALGIKELALTAGALYQRDAEVLP